MSDSITKVDFNFTNAGGGHTASVTSLVNPKSVKDGENLGIVVGELGEINNFSNSAISRILGNFTCTSITRSADATKKVTTRRYVDKTSLILDSCIILVRGINCGPNGGREFEGSVPYFTEVKGSPLASFNSQGPVRDGSVIYLGKIYNVESGASFSGVKISLVYQNKELKENLSLNTDLVNNSYESSPDLSQYDLKFGYTLSELKSALGQVGVPVEGLPINENILFQTSGTLSSVISSIAGSLGYFWYINPENGGVRFLNSELASQMPISSHINTTDPNILNASFTESTVFNKIVNTYSGTSERSKPNPKDDDRPRPIFFKRCRIEKHGLTKRAPLPVLGAFFSLIEQEEDDDSFDKFAYFCSAIAANGDIDNFILNGDAPQNLFPYSPISKTKLVDFMSSGFEAIFDNSQKDQEYTQATAKNTKLKSMNRITNKFKYLKLMHDDGAGTQKIPKPHTSELYSFLKSYFAIAGGIYISNGYSNYKSERMEFTNSNDIVVVGPLKGSEKIEDIKQLQSIATYLGNLNTKASLTVEDLATLTQNKDGLGGSSVVTREKNFFIGLRALPKLERENGKDGKVDFSILKNNYEFLDAPNLSTTFYIGGPSKGPNNAETLVTGIKNLIKKSNENFLEAISVKKTIRLTYKRSKTRINAISEDGEEDEDDAIAEQNDDGQKLADLFDRYDLKYNSVQSPAYSSLNKLSLSSSSGSTAEMKVLQQIRGKYIDGFDKPQSSTRTLYGLHIPVFSPTMNSVSISIGGNGITTTISESTIKLIPPDQSFMITEGMEALTPKSMLPTSLNASQRNALGL
tara:strand:+ start:384 stop:2804 length:2421 start_codon:yes stop_codon:yes gene_type:complete